VGNNSTPIQTTPTQCRHAPAHGAISKLHMPPGLPHSLPLIGLMSGHIALQCNLLALSVFTTGCWFAYSSTLGTCSAQGRRMHHTTS
jgi:hypothetical protein